MREPKKSLGERLAELEPMWTTDAHRYVLLQSEHGYVPVDVTGEQDMAVLIDEDDELADVVTARMREAGVPVTDDLQERH